MESTLDLLKKLADARVQFVLIGGLAAVAHGSSRFTEDTDVCAPLDEANIARIQQALLPHHPRFRFHPRLPPLPTDPADLRGFKSLNLLTDIGIIDILTEVTGVGTYEQVLQHSATMNVAGVPIQVLDLDALILAKSAANRLKDRLAIPELEAIRNRLKRE